MYDAVEIAAGVKEIPNRERWSEADPRGIKRDLAEVFGNLPDQFAVQGLAGYDDKLSRGQRQRGGDAQKQFIVIADDRTKRAILAHRLGVGIVCVIEEAGEAERRRLHSDING